MSSKLPSWLVPLVIIGVPLILFWPLVFGDRVLYWGTPLLQFYEWRQLVAEAFRAGHVPLWTHALGNGFPLLANLQSAALYPPNLLYLAFPIERAMGYSVVLHVILAGFLMYGFTRNLGLRQLPSLVSALSYMLSGFIISRAQFLSIIGCVPWLPLLFWLTDRVMNKRRWADALALGLVIAMQLLAGHAQLWIYGLWAMGLYALVLGVGKLWQGQPTASRPAAAVARQVLSRWGLMLTSGAVGLLAASAQLLPTAELAQLSQRAGGADYDFAMTYSFWPWRLITLVAPDFFGNPAHGDYWGYTNYWEDCGYIGLLPLILALVGVVLWVRNRRRRDNLALSRVPFMFGMCLVALVLAMGKNLPIYPLIFRLVPGFSFFQAPARFLYLYTFGMAALAGIGLHHLGTSERWARVSRYLLAVAVSLLIAVMIGALCLSNAARLTFLKALWSVSVLAVLSGIVLYLGTRWVTGRRRMVWRLLVVGLVAGDLLVFGWPLNPTTDASVYHSDTGTGTFLRRQARETAPFRTFTSDRFSYDTMFDGDSGFFRFKAFGPSDESHLRRLRETLIPNLPVLERIDSANNYDPLQIGYYQALLDYLGKEPPWSKALKLLGLMNVRYLVDDRPVDDLTPASSSEVKLFENPAYLPRAYLVYRARVIPEPAQQWAALTSDDFDPAQEVILSTAEGVGGDSASSDGDSAASSLALRYAPNSVTIDATLVKPGYLVLSDTYYPSWEAVVDGKRRAVLRANYAFRALSLSAGHHQIVFRYAPLSFRLGVWISAATWLCTLVTWLVLSRRSGLRPALSKEN